MSPCLPGQSLTNSIVPIPTACFSCFAGGIEVFSSGTAADLYPSDHQLPFQFLGTAGWLPCCAAITGYIHYI